MNWRLRIKIIFEPRDLWLGVFVKGPFVTWAEDYCAVEPPEKRLVLYVCLLPCLPIVVTFWRYKENQ